MHIVKLTSKNVLRLNAVEIKPDGNLVVIGGKNGAGKTSVLDSIMMALAGKDSKRHPEPLKRGKNAGRTEVELSNGWTVSRTYLPGGGGSLQVTAKDGGKHGQRKLNDFFSGLTFDPLTWVAMDSTKQLDTLKKLVGIDFGDLDGKRRVLYDNRTSNNREVKALQVTLESLEKHDDAPDREVSVEDLLVELEARRETNEENQAKRNNLAEMRRGVATQDEQIDDVQCRIGDLRNEIDELMEQLSNEKALRAKLDSDRLRITSVVADLQDADEQEIRQQIANSQAINAKVRDNQKRDNAELEFEGAQARSEILSSDIAEIDKRKDREMAKASFPVDGLGFDENGVTLNGIPFGQSSSAEALRVSVAMGIAMNPDLKVLLIRDGSLLDKESLGMVAEMANRSGHQIWIERVGTGDECQVIIEDGNVLV